MSEETPRIDISDTVTDPDTAIVEGETEEPMLEPVKLAGGGEGVISVCAHCGGRTVVPFDMVARITAPPTDRKPTSAAEGVAWANLRHVQQLAADKAASDDVIEALAARIAELEAALDRAEREREGHRICEENMDAALAAERARGDRLAEALRTGRCARCGEWFRDHAAARRALAADPEGGPTDG